MIALGLLLSGVGSSRALASSTQVSMFEDDPHLLSDPPGTLARLRLLGVDLVRVFVRWELIAPGRLSRRRPRNFGGSDPKDYAASAWAPYDRLVKEAQAAGIALNFDVTGEAPLWATGPGAPPDKPHPNWEPSASEFGKFAHAVGERYSGNYDPVTNSLAPGNPDDLPAVRFWSSWNEPDYGPSLGPQGVPGHISIEHSPLMYRELLDATWTALTETGHRRDTIIIGEVAPRGWDYFGMFSGMKPLRFLRALYCLDSSYHQLRGSAAAVRGCPTTSRGSARFRSAHPALFQASGFSDHPYMRWYPPNREAQPDPDYATLGEIGGLERALDRVQRAYGSSKRFPIYNTEFGYITSPPKHYNSKQPYISPSLAAYYINWAEYLSWRDPRIMSTNQYLLFDPLPAMATNAWGGYASGLLTYGRLPKADYAAYRLPLYMPVTSAASGHLLEVWGCVRAAKYAVLDTALPQVAELEFQPSSGTDFIPLATVTIANPSNCYFDLRLPFTASGTLRLSYTYPATDALLPAGYTVYSRHIQVTVH